MHHRQIFLVFFLLTANVVGRAVYYDDLETFSSEEAQDLETRLPNMLFDSNNGDFSYDSYEEKKFHQRVLSSSSKPSHTMSAQTRQVIVDILQEAIDQGWKPNPELKHYIPATRFGRHRR